MAIVMQVVCKEKTLCEKVHIAMRIILKKTAKRDKHNVSLERGP